MHTETRFGFSLSGLLRSCIHTLSTHWSHSGGWVLLGDNIGAESTDFELLVNTTKRSFRKRVYSLLCFWIFSPTLHYQSLIYIYIYFCQGNKQKSHHGCALLWSDSYWGFNMFSCLLTISISSPVMCFFMFFVHFFFTDVKAYFIYYKY